MSLWIIEPHEPLIFRDGRPFNAHPGVRAHSLPFPFPSTTTGAVRTQVGLDDHGVFTWKPDELDQLKQLQVRGPLLVQLPEPGNEQEPLKWFAPAPADALLLNLDEKLRAAGYKEKADLRRLVPLRIGDNEQTYLTDLTKEFDPPLALVGSTRSIKGKPSENPPAYWRWDIFQKWLLHPSECLINNWGKLGIHGPQSEVRVHISIDRDKHTSKDGALFETRGMEFINSDKENAHFNAHQLALAVSVDDKKLEPRKGFSTLGGERRMVYWRQSGSNTDFPQCPKELIEQIKDACRVILLTPAYFHKGCYPTELLKEREGVKPSLRAIAVQRPQIVSGWEFARRSADGKSWEKPGPKKTRRLTPAGSVFFLNLEGTETAIEQWIAATWMHSISDDQQDCLDGFGLAVIGTWDGQPQDMGKEQEVSSTPG
jgi:CRISPR-associated protein Cmr3